MNARPVEQWMEIFNKLPAPMSASVEEHIANRVIGDLVGYNFNSKNRVRDVRELSNAMQAYARMMQDAGVKA